MFSNRRCWRRETAFLPRLSNILPTGTLTPLLAVFTLVKKLRLVTAVATGLTALSLGFAAPVVADDRDLIPVCTGNDISLNSACRTADLSGTAQIVGVPAVSPGANPYVPLGPGD